MTKSVASPTGRVEVVEVQSYLKKVALRRIGVFMYVNALFGWWRPGGSTCDDSAPRSGRARADGGGGRVRHPATPLGRWRRGACARPPKGLCEGTFRRDKLGLFKGTFEGTFRRV
jgi:hypothetical protein